MKKCPKCAEKVQPAAVVCKHCGYEFSAAEMKAAKTGQLVSGLIVAGVLVLAAYACSNMSGTTTADAPDNRPEMRVTPKELADAYDANEAAAKQRFDGNILIVTGVVAGVDLDLTDQPSVKLVAANQFLPVQASLVEASKPAASSLQKGATVQMRCLKITEVIGTPMLGDCTIL